MPNSRWLSNICPKQQADATISQANPVSATLYEVLPATRNVRIRSIFAEITWAVTQPTPLEVVVTVDEQTLIFAFTNPVSTTAYYAVPRPWATPTAQILSATDPVQRSFLLEGRSVRVQTRITWAVTQPTPLVCRVKYAKW